ncbi:hypothetical protein A2755_02510 [Candidatus Wolfebacteria bacterium RIFCSPHIGHO2_01_FULL_48_22]|uniref:LamG-like jellyroll fold domain-containing protein n=2 Tax=Candidatus Wolfeibacteriota TaxID=1752735 RepID=A0A1F8DRJ2_9BACT|nr:MAG: hypothetical protein A2755_02510 [Candidatus Wolfebacteria bacterium RIFCSPHIGHO2_01_FULL_48_22]OGM92251.1 MAG: hypothetical protein A2935_00560 [Candidatus Wolfebacteria bacterium RIFCSPLOWO2_01_FULL_47_17b]
MNSGTQFARGIRYTVYGIRSFTVVELVIVIALVAILVAVATVNILNFRTEQALKQDAQMVAGALHFAQSKAQLGDGGVDWGIRLSGEANGGYLEIFQGSSYSTSTVAELKNLSSASKFLNPVAGNIKTILFTALTGLPSTAHTIVLGKDGSADSVYMVTVSSLGKIEIYKETGLVGMWEFDEGSGTNAYDASGNGNTGTLTNFDFSGSSDWVSLGKSGGALSFDGSNDYIFIGNPSQYQFIHSSSFTLTAWIYADSVSSGFKHIAGKSYLDYRFAQNNTAFSFRLDSNNMILEAPSSIETGNWVYVAGVYNGDTKKTQIFVDGLESASSTNETIDWTTTSNDFQIGNSPGESYYFDGYIDDVRIYNRALSAEEIKRIYESY